MAEGDADLQDLYRDVLLDYYRSQAHKGSVKRPDLSAHGINPVCGDEVELTMSHKAGVLREVRYRGRGCVISQASSAMMSEAVEGKSLKEARALAGAFKAFLLEGASADSLPPDLEEAKALDGVRKFPVRIKYALLGWNTLLQGHDGNGGK
ncbi:MAG: Fe-S cluster assembly sulfur transfer protein SufU [Elusimicrobiota bacterium]